MWQIMSEGKLRLREVTEGMLITAEENNLNYLRQLDSKKASAVAKVIKNMFRDYPQLELFYCIEAILMQEEKAGAVRGEYSGLLHLKFKTIIDCFNNL
jgi:hypothetical protein